MMCINERRARAVRVKFVNTRWRDPAHVTVKEGLCVPDADLLAVSFYPRCLPGELNCVTITAHDVITLVFLRLQTQQPSALMIISGRFNNNNDNNDIICIALF